MDDGLAASGLSRVELSDREADPDACDGGGAGVPVHGGEASRGTLGGEASHCASGFAPSCNGSGSRGFIASGIAPSCNGSGAGSTSGSGSGSGGANCSSCCGLPWYANARQMRWTSCAEMPEKALLKRVAVGR